MNSLTARGILVCMAAPQAIDEITPLQIEYSLKAAQMNLAHAEEQLTLKKARWYECVLFGGAGATIAWHWPRPFLYAFQKLVYPSRDK